jgi:tetrahydromethanopterin S-methyltransferase subunit G
MFGRKHKEHKKEHKHEEHHHEEHHHEEHKHEEHHHEEHKHEEHADLNQLKHDKEVRDAKTEALNERLNALEERLRYVLGELEKRIESTQQHTDHPPEERFQELEDLLLLLQLETTKMKDRVGEGGLDFGVTPTVPDMAARLNRLEEEVANRSTPAVSHDSHDSHDSDARIAELEKRIDERHSINVSKDTEKHIKSEFAEYVRDLEMWVKTLEALLEKRGKDEITEAENNLLADIQGILKH